jgi:hypothetical protein
MSVGTTIALSIFPFGAQTRQNTSSACPSRVATGLPVFEFQILTWYLLSSDLLKAVRIRLIPPVANMVMSGELTTMIAMCPVSIGVRIVFPLFTFALQSHRQIRLRLADHPDSSRQTTLRLYAPTIL